MAFGRYDYAAFAAFFAYAAGSVVVPVALVSLARDLGFSLEHGGMSAGGALHLGRTLSMVAAMLLCGFAAGRWGKRWTLGTSTALMGAGVLLCALAPGYGVLLFALALAGLGEGVIEGLATPFVQDLHTDEPGRYINFAHSFWSIGVLVTVLYRGADNLRISWRVVIGAVALLGFSRRCCCSYRAQGTRLSRASERLHWQKVWAQALTIFRTLVSGSCRHVRRGGGELYHLR